MSLSYTVSLSTKQVMIYPDCIQVWESIAQYFYVLSVISHHVIEPIASSYPRLILHATLSRVDLYIPPTVCSVLTVTVRFRLSSLFLSKDWHFNLNHSFSKHVFIIL